MKDRKKINYADYEEIPSPPENESPKINYADYGLIEEPEPEDLAGAAIMAIPRVGKDIGEGIFNFLRSIPGYAQEAGTEIPGLADLIMRHPGQAAKQFGAGITELGHGLINTPASLDRK